MNAAQPPIPPLHYIVSFRWKDPRTKSRLGWMTPEFGTCHSMADVITTIGEYGEEEAQYIRVICADLTEGTAADVTAEALAEMARTYTNVGEPCPWWLLDHDDYIHQFKFNPVLVAL